MSVSKVNSMNCDVSIHFSKPRGVFRCAVLSAVILVEVLGMCLRTDCGLEFMTRGYNLEVMI